MGRPAEALESYGRALATAPRDEQALRAGRSCCRRRTQGRGGRAAGSPGGGGARRKRAPGGRQRRGAAALELAESRERRRQVESYAERLRASAGDEAAARALAHARVLEPPVAPQPPGPDVDLAPEPPIAAAVEPVVEPDAQSRAGEPGPEPLEAPSLKGSPRRRLRQASPGNRAHGRCRGPREGVEAATAAEEAIDAFALGRAAEDALAAGDAVTARDGLLAAAAAHRRAGRSFAAIDACYIALAVAPADVDLHVLLTELYLERGWRGPAVDKLLLLGRLADLAEDSGTRERLCAIATDQLPEESGSPSSAPDRRHPSVALDAPADSLNERGPMLHSREDGPAPRIGRRDQLTGRYRDRCGPHLLALHPDLRTRAVSLVIGVTVLFAVYAAARFFGLQLLTQILRPGPSSGCSRSSSSSSRSCGGRSSGSAGSGPSTGRSRRPSSGPSSTSPTRSPTPRRSSRPMAMGRSSSSSVTPASRKWRRPA